jgi:2-amino-4-hydroxy-6-hydroxymethyldihydropteridine diphosphokinase
MVHNVYLITGSNLGNSLSNLLHVKKLIREQLGEIIHESSVYKTAPWGNLNQQDFLNQALHIQTSISPQALMREILTIESSMGRKRIEKWEPRIIDVDILFYDTLVLDIPDLVIPHPLLHERRFVLAPLFDIAPNFIHPQLNKSVSELLDSCNDMSKVDKL